ncbi:MAG: GNAT family N-acetyltransferase [Myxococcales bacterium]|nr:GNAT family N-acetyltransferase [Myxococcales bacterium]
MDPIELLDGVASLPRDEWNALVGDDSPFLEWEWLASLEEAGCVGPGTGWQPQPLTIRRHGRLVAACPLYFKGNSEGEFVFDYSWADAAERSGLRYYPKLLVGVPFTPVTGARFLVAKGEDRSHWIPVLAAALRELCHANELSSIHVNFCHESEARLLEDSEYHVRIGIQYHWRNDGFDDFEDYLSRFRSKRRNQIRRERRSVAEQGIRVHAVAGNDITDDLFDSMFDCYLATVRAHSWGRQYLNQRFFELLSERFRHRLCFVVARYEGEVIGGTINIVKGDTFYGRYWGALRPARFLHFEACYYKAIEFCIERGLQRMEPGAGGDYKWLRGFDAAKTYSLHHLADPRLARAVERFLESERHEASRVVAELERESPLRKRSISETPRRLR